MLRVKKIIDIKPYHIVCEFNNGILKELDVLPLLLNHKHLVGIEKLKNPSVFSSAKIGEFGEIFWENIILNPKTNDYWNYDISPEFIFNQKE